MIEAFEKRMKDMLQEEYPMFVEELNKDPQRGYRINLLKTDEEEFFKLTNFEKKKTGFAKNGYYLINETGVGNMPVHAAGLMYMQEPSASSVVPLMDVKPYTKVLDLCAAPGSKTTEIAERMENTGMLVANEIHPKRVRILQENVIRYGLCNTIVINNKPQQIADCFGEYFDYVLVDAPCGGEGMMRKNEEAINNWSIDNVLLCAKRQKEILDCAYRCLKPGGIMLYSTCTFALEENEENMVWFTNKYQDMKLLPINVPWGRSGFDLGNNTNYTRRIFPMDHGEGHFMARLQKDADPSFKETDLPSMKSDVLPKCVKEFIKENLVKGFAYYYVYKDRVYGGNLPFYDLHGLHVINHQVFMGKVVKGRFVPSHDLAMNAFLVWKNNIDVNEEDAKRFLKGETLKLEGKKGYYRVNYGKNGIGYGKCDGKILKNHIPKELRIR